MRTADSVYAHLDRILVREGKQIVRGQQIGTIGTNRGMYTAHLHFEVRKNPLHWLQPERFRQRTDRTTMSQVASSLSTANFPDRAAAPVAINTFNLR